MGLPERRKLLFPAVFVLAACRPVPAPPARAPSLASPRSARAAPARAGPDAGPAPAAPSGPAPIRLERTACFGSCPIYVVELEPDGRVVFDGKDHTVGGRHVARVDAGAVTRLADELVGAGFFSLHWDARCAGGQVPDRPSVIVTLRIGDRTRTISHDHGDRCAPRALDALEQRIDAVAGTARWLGVE